jgi:hypothetical protein
MSTLLTAVLGGHSLVGLPTDTEIDQLTAEQQQELHQRLRNVIIEFRDRSRAEISALRERADDDLQRLLAERSSATQQQPTSTIRRPRRPPSSTHSTRPGRSSPERPHMVSPNENLIRIPYSQSVGRRLLEIDREIAAITRRYRTVASWWHA